MNELATQPPRGPDIECPPIAMDVTRMLAASSFIEGFDGRADPRAAEEFEATANAFCSGSPLRLPLPKGSLGGEILFLRLWNQCHDLIHVPGVELSDQAFDWLVANDRAEEFARIAELDYRSVSKWIAFQFSRTLAEDHLRRADLLVTERCVPVATDLIKKGTLPKLLRSIGGRINRGQFDWPEVYRSKIRSYRSLQCLSIAYAISVALRGVSYSQALTALGTNPSHYRCHWIRKSVVQTIEDNGGECTKEKCEFLEFPWGPILRDVFKPRKSVMPDLAQVENVLLGLREQARSVRRVLEQGLFDSPENSREAVDQVHKWLSRAECGWQTEPRNALRILEILKRFEALSQEVMTSGVEMSSSPDILAKAIGAGMFVVGAAGRFGRKVVELVSTKQLSESHITIYRDVDPAIREALRSFRALRHPEADGVEA